MTRAELAPDRAAALAVEDRLHTALAGLRVVVTLNTLAMAAWRWENHRHPGWTMVALTVLVAWTVAVVWVCRAPQRRVPALLVADLVMAAALMASTPLLKGPDFNATVPGFWVMGAMLLWAIHWGWRGGLVASTVLVVVDVAIRPHITQHNYGNIFLLLLGGSVIGYMCESLKRMAIERAVAERRAAVEEERTRLARAVHDGVLQVLALVQRRGSELGGDFAELARMAGEQEGALRALIHAQDTLTVAGPGGTPARGNDLSGALEALASPQVTVVTPGRPEVLPALLVTELVAAVSACLDNVRMHVGFDAPAWVLLETYDDRVVVTVRDEGPGIPEGRLEAARADGRLGVKSSICGRLAELGGTAEVQTGSWGTEWELTAPRPGHVHGSEVAERSTRS